MTSVSYSIQVLNESGFSVFYGYFVVDTSVYPNLITAFYDYSLPGIDVILPGNDPNSYPESDNIYPLDNAGVNFYSTALQNFFGLSQNHINLYHNPPRLYTVATEDLLLPTHTVIISPLSRFPCFKVDTKILTDKGYVPIQDLKKGDLVKTLLHDYKSIDTIGVREIKHSISNDRIKEQLYKCTNENYPEVFEDLILTGCHSILVPAFKDDEQREKTMQTIGKIYVTDNRYRLPACVDDRALIYEIPGTYDIYHLALENEDYFTNYGIYANGLLVETCSKRFLKEYSNMKLIE
jgi:hypothetical protein